VAEYELIARQTTELEEKVMELHPELNGVTASEADVRFLKKAQTLDTYGIDPHPVKVALYSWPVALCGMWIAGLFVRLSKLVSLFSV